MTNKLAAIKKETRYTQKETKPKPNLSVRSAHMSVHISGYNCATQYSTEKF